MGSCIPPVFQYPPAAAPGGSPLYQGRIFRRILRTWFPTKMLLLLLPIIVTASQGPLPPGFEEASWQKAIENYFATSTPSLLAALLGFPTKTRFPQDRIALDVSQSIGAAAGLETDGDWPAAVSKTLARQSILGNIVSETFKGITRIVGWGLMSLVLYPNVFEYRRRRRRETPSERRARAAAEGLSISRRQTREKASKSKIKANKIE